MKETNKATGHELDIHKLFVTCPSCHALTNERIHRSLLQKTLLFWHPVKRYACLKCNRKFMVWS
jgi:transposase-like protein